MNERIKELEKQSYVNVDVGDGVYQKFSTEKFAELLIKECAEICRRQQYYDADDEFKRGSNAGAFTCMNAIKRNFGVK